MKKLSFLRKHVELLLHLTFWFVVALLIYFKTRTEFIHDPYLADFGIFSSLHKKQLLHYFLLLVFKAIFFYVNILLIFPRYRASGYQRKYLLPLLVSLGWCFTIEVLMFTWGTNSMLNMLSEDYYIRFDYSPVSDGFFVYLAVLLASYAYWASKQWLLDKEGLQKLDVTAAELALLKNQVNPHFLFNTLNNLFSMAIEKNADELAESIAQLTHLMRYSIYESHVPFIELQREVEYIENYIKLQKLRFSGEEEITIRFDVEGDRQQVRISPMLLINFVENAFKHGVSLKQESYILIELRITESELFFTVENTIYRQNKTAAVKHAGFGLEHVKKLLQLQYPGRHNLSITEENNIYKTVLRLELQKTQVAITALQ
ncbi:sensor histidine kinase [Pontibacter sp. SGAir0037]|uniref:sensor histidine kinase n=1 Tax=Pontibacter sp. SGAir0037 TaxID=2571030 RepID=UPI0010CD1893|nr:histidine kinase [Pontibacter sp. SGAir0037]QCR23730.1 hypothetical protein C1N53_16175 [Pontibacter sp. SGAir0037]